MQARCHAKQVTLPKRGIGDNGETIIQYYKTQAGSSRETPPEEEGKAPQEDVEELPEGWEMLTGDGEHNALWGMRINATPK